MEPKTSVSAMGWRSSRLELGLKVALREPRSMTPKFHQELSEHMELCSMLCGSLDGKAVLGRMDTCICMVESLCCSPETITTLAVNQPIPQYKINF